MKRRKRQEKAEPATAAHEAADGHADAMREDGRLELDALKDYRQRGAHGGPGEPLVPGHPLPGNFDRMPLEEGHAAQSPQHEGPHADPIPMRVPGLLESVALPGAARAQHIDYRVTEALALGSPSER